jgi:hypothetical protein
METYVFGAGASAPYGAPTMGEFLSRAFSGWWTVIPPDLTDFEEDLGIVAGAIDGQYGTNILAAQHGGDHISAEVALRKINVEELLASADENRTPDIRQALDRVIFRTIERNMHDSGNRGYYKLVMSEILKSGQKACLISFNYDLLLDRALTDATHHATSTWSYAVPFHAGVEQFPSYRDSADPAIFLLKLHGSLNWGQCPKCDRLRLWFYNTYDDIFRKTWPNCKNCSEISMGFKPVLVAPSPAKRLPSALNSAWNAAANCLQTTEKLTIIGYSFSAFDHASRRLFLKNFIIPNLSVDPAPKLTIIDPDQCARKSIRSLFLPAVEKNVAEYSSFEDYCKMLQQSRYR